MDNIKVFIDVLRPCAQQPGNLNALAAAERLINEYFQNEAAALTRAMDAEAKIRKNEDWSPMRHYVQTCLGRLLGEIDERRLKD